VYPIVIENIKDINYETVQGFVLEVCVPSFFNGGSSLRHPAIIGEGTVIVCISRSVALLTVG
jgi:hypothetical protein